MEGVRYMFLDRDDARPWLAGINRLYREAGWWDGPDDLNAMYRLVCGCHAFLLAATGDEAVGMARALSDGVSDAYLHDLTVRPDMRRKGIGSELARRMVEKLRSQGIMWTAVIAEPGAEKLYPPLGFQVMSGATPMLSWVKKEGKS